MRVPCSFCKTSTVELPDGSPVVASTKITCRNCAKKAVSLRAEAELRKTGAAKAVLGSPVQGEGDEPEHTSLSVMEDDERAAPADDEEDSPYMPSAERNYEEIVS